MALAAAVASPSTPSRGGRLTLGIGLSHKVVIENMLGHELRQAGPPHP